MTAEIDYTMFCRMCESAAYLNASKEYIDALWEYYEDSEIGDALSFFDNLFQYTKWYDKSDFEGFLSEYDLEDYIIRDEENCAIDYDATMEEIIDCDEMANYNITYNDNGILLI